MKRFLILLLLTAGTASAQQEPAAAPPVPSPDATPAPAPEALPEDEIETVLQRSAEHYEAKRRARAGGALLEVAEIVESLAAEKADRVAAEAEAFRHLALQASRGQLNAHAVDFAAARAYVKLASLFHARQAGSWHHGNPKAAGRDWYRSITFLERSVEWGGYGLRDAGDETLTGSKVLAEGLATGQPVDADEMRKAAERTGRMINEVGRALAVKAGAEWEPEPVAPMPPAAGDARAHQGDFVESPPAKAAKKPKSGAAKLGDFFRRLGDGK